VAEIGLLPYFQHPTLVQQGMPVSIINLLLSFGNALPTANACLQQCKACKLAIRSMTAHCRL